MKGRDDLTPPSYNLVDQQWIPVEDLEGGRREVSLLQCFQMAPELKRVMDASPLITAAIYRLLFAIMNRSLRIRDVEDWQERWDEQHFSGEVTAYLQEHRDRLDLFSEEAPFGQALAMPENCKTISWTKLAMELPPNSSKLLFDHTYTEEPPLAAPAEVTRYLLASLAFTVGAGKSCTGYTSNAPLTASLVVIPEGRTLAETLLANLHPSLKDDLPIWERQPFSAQNLADLTGVVWTGPAARLTWPSRCVRLIPEDRAGNVRWIQFGMGLPTPQIEGDRDPWVPYRVTGNGMRIPRKLEPDRMIWRDFHGLLGGASDGTGNEVLAVSRLAALNDAERRPPANWTILVCGLSADKASVLAWRQERWSLPDRLIGDDQRVSALQQSIINAEDLARQLNAVNVRLARELLSDGDGQPDRQQLRQMADGMPMSEIYWTNLGLGFQSYLHQLAVDPDSADTAWRETQAAALSEVKSTTYKVLGRDARSLRAWAKCGAELDRLIGVLRRNKEAPLDNPEVRVT